MTIFLSHARDDDDAAVEGLVQVLDEFGESVWLDRKNLVGGDLWWPEILKQIRECDVFVFAVSENSLTSDACNEEFRYAAALNRPILPVEIGDVPERLRGHSIYSSQSVEFRGPGDSTPRLLRAVSEKKRADHALPDPLPPEPDAPIGYLGGEERQIRGLEDLSRADQESIIRALRFRLRQDPAPQKREVIRRLLLDFRDRDDVLVKTEKEINELLGSIDAPVKPITVVGPTTEIPPITPVSPPPDFGPLPPPGTAEGWLPDPRESNQLRYFDGSHWTAHEHPLAQTSESTRFSTLGIVLGLVSLIPFVSWGAGWFALGFGIAAVVRRQRRGGAALTIGIVGPLIGAVITGSIFSLIASQN